MALTDRERARHAHALLLPGVGEAGQERLKAARVRVVGAGAVAGPALLFLAGAGVGTLFVDGAGPAEGPSGDSWIGSPSDRGAPRAAPAIDAARAASGLVEVAAYRPVDAVTAGLVAADSQDERQAVAAALQASCLPHVVAEADGEGGAVTVIPIGAPCYGCAFRPRRGARPSSTANAAVGLLAAMELVLLLAGATQEPRGRCIDLIRGVPLARPTVRLPGCACGR